MPDDNPVEIALVIRRNHIINKILLIGVVSGIALIAALYIPLEVLMPASYVEGWGEGVEAVIFETDEAAAHGAE